MKRISRKGKMTIVVILAFCLSGYVLSQWSSDESLTVWMILVSLLIHVLIPSFLAWAIIYKRLVNN
jgi:hypothetical protein